MFKFKGKFHLKISSLIFFLAFFLIVPHFLWSQGKIDLIPSTNVPLESKKLEDPLDKKQSDRDVFAKGKKFWQAQKAFRDKDYKNSYELFSKLIEENPKSTFALLGRAMTLTRLGEVEKSLKDLDIAIALDSKNSSFYLHRGKVFLALKREREALEDFNVAIRLSPTDPVPFYHRALVYASLFLRDQAIIDLDKTIELDPTFFEAFRVRGSIFSFLGENRKAIKDFNKALTINQKDALSYLYRGYSHVALGNSKKALEDFNKAESLKLDAKDIYSAKAIAYKRLGNIDKAIDEYSHGLKIDPNWVVGYFNRANAWLLKGKIFRARKDYQKVVELSSLKLEEGKDPIVFLNRAKAHRALGNVEQADKDFSQSYLLFEAVKDQVMLKKVASELEDLRMTQRSLQ